MPFFRKMKRQLVMTREEFEVTHKGEPLKMNNAFVAIEQETGRANEVHLTFDAEEGYFEGIASYGNEFPVEFGDNTEGVSDFDVVSVTLSPQARAEVAAWLVEAK